MNPFTKFLSQSSSDYRFVTFIEKWDELERIVIGVYRGKIPPDAAESDWQSIRVWLGNDYHSRESALRPYWQMTSAAGNPTATDPFYLLLDIRNAADIPGNWRAMQHLPAAREAINRYLLDHDD